MFFQEGSLSLYMQTQVIEYPQYRKYKNGKSYFRIFSPTLFEEIQILGKYHVLHTFEAKILPDRNLIYDMTFDYASSWEVIAAAEFLSVLELAG
jgi:hypothetical protein